MAKKKVALTLAGGGSLGSYEVGAIEALKELGYEFNIVTGTSIGALNGAFVCGKQEDNLRALWEGIRPELVMKNGINLSVRQLGAEPKATFALDLAKWTTSYLKGGRIGADISPFKEYVKNALNVDACYESDIKFGAVTTKFPIMELVDVEMQKLPKEEFLPFLHASSACFPVFPIETINKQRYVDGFYKDNLPIRLAFKLGAADVIAIDMRLFSLEPQNAFYQSLPNVEYIAPYITLGSMMDFSQEVIGKNMILGYNDVMKHFKKYRGFSFTIKDDIVAHHFLSYLLKAYDTDSKFVLDEITEGIRDPMDETDYFIRTLEIIALRLGIEDYYTTFSYKDFKDLIVVKLKERMAKHDEKESLLEKTEIFKSTPLALRSVKFFNEFLVGFCRDFLKLS